MGFYLNKLFRTYTMSYLLVKSSWDSDHTDVRGYISASRFKGTTEQLEALAQKYFIMKNDPSRVYSGYENQLVPQNVTGVLNELDSFFGYKVVASSSSGDSDYVWTLKLNEGT